MIVIYGYSVAHMSIGISLTNRNMLNSTGMQIYMKVDFDGCVNANYM